MTETRFFYNNYEISEDNEKIYFKYDFEIERLWLFYSLVKIFF